LSYSGYKQTNQA